MVDVRFVNVSEGTCHWCHKEKKKVFEVAFSDQSLKGRICGTCLLNALQFKVAMTSGSSADLPNLFTKEKL